MKKIAVPFLLLSIIFIATHSWSQENVKSSLSSAETVAGGYMSAFFRGDIKLAVSHMHPDMLEFNKEKLRQAYQQAKGAGKEEEFKKGLEFIKDFDALLELPAPEVWIRLLDGNRKRANKSHLDAMATAVVKVVQSERAADDGAKVRLHITTPGSKGKFEQETVLLLKLYKGEWRVAGEERMN